MTSGPDNRKENRLPHGTEVRVLEDEAVDFVEKFSGDVSRGGIFVQTPRPLPIGKEVNLTITLPGGGHIEASGTVAWVRAEEDPVTGAPPGMGVQFKRLGPGIEVLIGPMTDPRGAGFDADGIHCLLISLRRNRRGEAVREGRIVTGESLTIGRASEKDIHLPDPRVALHHATIRAKSVGGFAIESAGPDLRVDGEFCQTADLAIGMKIEIGPYQFVVETPGLEGFPEHALALTIERLQIAPEAANRIHSFATSLEGTYLSKRRPAVLLAAAVGLVFLLLPALQAASPSARARFKDAGYSPGKSWNPGLLSAGHRGFAEDCPSCHAMPFAKVRDEECIACHSGVGNHIQDAGLNEAVMGDTRCQSCHRDHRGARGMTEFDAALCVDCHGTIAQKHPEAKQPNITSITADHPAFALVGKTPGVRGDPRPSADARTDIVFPHDIHLSKEGVRSPKSPAGSDGKVILQCASCHELMAGRDFYQPVSMQEHCADCHRLEFEPGRTARQVPHGSVLAVIDTLREFYAGVAIGTTPMVAPPPKPTMISRPGGKPPRDVMAATQAPGVEWVLDNAEKAATELFEKRVCHDCHQIERLKAAENDPAAIRGGTWRVQPVVQVERWIPKSTFNHSQHSSEKCDTCHAAATSKTTADVLIPSIEVCRKCHVSVPAMDKVTSGCETCHGYHVHTPEKLEASAR